MKTLFLLQCKFVFVLMHALLSLTVLYAQPLKEPEPGSEYYFQHYDLKDGLADDFVWSIAQDSRGFMWFQYYGGLTRFDGYDFKVYKYNKEDSRSALNSVLGPLHKDYRGNLWIIPHHSGGGTKGDKIGLVKYDYKTDGFVKFTTDLSSKNLRSARFDKSAPVLWLGKHSSGGLASINTDTHEVRTYLNRLPDSISTKFRWQRNSIYTINDRGTYLLLGTWQGVWKFDKTTEVFSRPTCHSQDSFLVYHHPILDIIDVPGTNEIWLNTGGGLVRFNERFEVVQRSQFPDELILLTGDGFKIVDYMSSVRDREGIIWIASYHGLCRYDPGDGSIVILKTSKEDPYSLRSNSLNRVIVDRDGNVWVCSDKGVSRLARSTMKFFNYEAAGIAGNSIYKTKERDLILFGRGTDLYSVPIAADRLDVQNAEKVLSINNGFINSLRQGKTHLWTSEIFGQEVRGYAIDPRSGAIAKDAVLRLRPDTKNKNTLSDYTVSTIWEDQTENLWLGQHGLAKVNLKIPYGEIGSVINYSHVDSDTTSLGDNTIMQFVPENDNSFWVVTAKTADLFHAHSEKFDHVFGDREILNNLIKTSDGTLYLGTQNALYEGKKVGDRYQFNPTPLWSKAEVVALQEDNVNRLWMYTRIGAVCYDRKEKIFIEFNETDNARHLRAIERGWFHKTSEGKMIMLDPDGLTVFDPMRLTIDRRKTHPVLTKLEVNNRIPVIRNNEHRGDEFVLPVSISELEEFTIDYEHNNFTIEFSAMDMSAPEKNLYRHKLEGFDKDWIETDSRNRSATYTNLDAGVYIFKVKASNHHSIWSDVERKIKIRVLPPPWKSIGAYTGYGILFIGLLYAGRKSIVQRERLKSNLRLEKVEREKEHFELEKAKEIDKVKSTFFANISHEFRTPLTLIKGPVQELMEEFGAHPKVKERLNLVQRNADLVLKLINQLLDLAKLESGTLTVEKTENDLNAFLRAVTGSFSSLALQKNIILKTELPQERMVLSFDKGKVETILINLINNAIKFTPPGGLVTVRAELKADGETKSAAAPLLRRGVGGEVIITVSDTGIGIPIDQQSKVFERFHQVSEAHHEVGTGIGLALVRELVALMDGTISLTSQPGKGSVFTVTLPVEQLEVFTEAVSETVARQEVYDNGYSAIGDHRDNGEGQLPHVLVVEDNTDLRKFIIDSLGKEFHFLEAADGKEGMEKAFEFVPDVIISDVMMPEMDGITMTGKIKNDTRTSHIPLILLTAKTTDESKLKGLGTGADDYLTKPFNKNELLLKVRNSIALRVKLREKIKLELLKEGPKTEVQSADEKFLYNVREIILSRLSDEQLSVESLAEEIALSRSQLLRKVTALTGVSVNELIRTFRLQKAAQLLEQNWGSVTQVAYEVGISNLSYFSKVFKEQYGMMPSEYLAKKTG